MSAVTSANGSTFTPILTAASTATSQIPPTASQPLSSQDKVELSLAGRVALGVSDGDLTTDQGQQLYSQLKTTASQIQSSSSGSKQALGQLSEQIYGDAHDGATIPAGSTVTAATARDTEEAGRVVAQENAGNLTSTQASGFLTQIGQFYQQSQSGTTASVTNQAQNQLSTEIYNAAHDTAVPAAA